MIRVPDMIYYGRFLSFLFVGVISLETRLNTKLEISIENGSKTQREVVIAI